MHSTHTDTHPAHTHTPALAMPLVSSRSSTHTPFSRLEEAAPSVLVVVWASRKLCDHAVHVLPAAAAAVCTTQQLCTPQLAAFDASQQNGPQERATETFQQEVDS